MFLLQPKFLVHTYILSCNLTWNTASMRLCTIFLNCIWSKLTFHVSVYFSSRKQLSCFLFFWRPIFLNGSSHQLGSRKSLPPGEESMLFFFAVQCDLIWIAPKLYKIVPDYLYEIFWPAMLVSMYNYHVNRKLHHAFKAEWDDGDCRGCGWSNLYTLFFLTCHRKIWELWQCLSLSH